MKKKMKQPIQKMISCILCMAMVLTLMPAHAFASENNGTSSEASVTTSGGVITEFPTFKEAVATAQSGDTVTLLKDCTMVEIFTVASGVTVNTDNYEFILKSTMNINGDVVVDEVTVGENGTIAVTGELDQNARIGVTNTSGNIGSSYDDVSNSNFYIVGYEDTKESYTDGDILTDVMVTSDGTLRIADFIYKEDVTVLSSAEAEDEYGKYEYDYMAYDADMWFEKLPSDTNMVLEEADNAITTDNYKNAGYYILADDNTSTVSALRTFLLEEDGISIYLHLNGKTISGDAMTLGDGNFLTVFGGTISSNITLEQHSKLSLFGGTVSGDVSGIDSGTSEFLMLGTFTGTLAGNVEMKIGGDAQLGTEANPYSYDGNPIFYDGGGTYSLTEDAKLYIDLSGATDGDILAENVESGMDTDGKLFLNACIFTNDIFDKTYSDDVITLTGMTVDEVNKTIYANGCSLVIKDGTDGASTVYLDADDEIVVKENVDLSDWTIYGGSKEKDTEQASVTIQGGNVGKVYAGGKGYTVNEANGADVTVRISGTCATDIYMTNGGVDSNEMPILKVSTLCIQEGNLTGEITTIGEVQENYLTVGGAGDATATINEEDYYKRVTNTPSSTINWTGGVVNELYAIDGSTTNLSCDLSGQTVKVALYDSSKNAISSLTEGIKFITLGEGGDYDENTFSLYQEDGTIAITDSQMVEIGSDLYFAPSFSAHIDLADDAQYVSKTAATVTLSDMGYGDGADVFATTASIYAVGKNGTDVKVGEVELINGTTEYKDVVIDLTKANNLVNSVDGSLQVQLYVEFDLAKGVITTATTTQTDAQAIVLNKKALEFTVTGTEQVYDGTDKAVTITDTDSSLVASDFTITYYKETGTGTLYTTAVTPKEAGSYLYVISKNENGNYDETYYSLGSTYNKPTENSDMKPSPDEYNNIGYMIISQASMTINAIASQSTTYNSESQSPIAPTGTTVNGQKLTVKYMDGNGDYSLTEIPSYENAGKYSIYYEMTADNHETVEDQITFTIDKVQLTWDTNGTVYDKVYDDRTDATVNITPTLNGVISGDETPTITRGKVVFESADVGTHEITASEFTIVESTNYEAPVEQPVFADASITAKEVIVTPKSGQFKYYGEDDPIILFDEVMDVNGDSLDLTGELSRTEGNAIADNYVIEIGTLACKSANYYIIFIEGVTFAITQYTTNAVIEDLPEWSNTEEIKLVPPTGYDISISNALNGNTWASSYYTVAATEGEDVTYTYYLKSDSGAISEEKTVIHSNDQGAPTGEIIIGVNKFKEFLNNITFGMFFKEKVDVTITGEDTLSGVDTIEYQKVATEADYSEEGTWITASSFSVEEPQTFIVYARITDEAGNATIINSEGVVIYKDSEAKTTDIVFTKLSTTDVTADVTTKGNTILGITNGAYTLTSADYFVSEESNNITRITFKASYLDTLSSGDYTFTISYNPQGEAYVDVSTDSVEPLDTTIALKVSPKAVSGLEVKLSDTTKAYDGTALKPAITVYDGETEVSSSCYTVTYSEEVTVGTKEVKIEFSEPYIGTLTEYVKITNASITVNGIDTQSTTYNSTSQSPIAPTGTTVNGQTLTVKYKDGNGDYSLTEIPSYDDVGVYYIYYEMTADNHETVEDKITFTIAKATPTITASIEGWTYGGTASAPSFTTSSDGTSVTYAYSDSQDGTYTSGVPSDVGTYYMKATVAETSNYDGATSTAVKFSIAYAEVVSGSYSVIEGWDYESIITAANGYTISTSPTGSYGSTIKVSEESETIAGTEVTVYIKNEADGTIGEETVICYVDQSNPMIDVTMNDNVLKQIINTLTLNIFFKETVEVKITATDSLSGVEVVKYQVVTEEAPYDSINGWIEGTTFSVKANEQFELYVMAQDYVGSGVICTIDSATVYRDSAAKTTEIAFTKLSTEDVIAEVITNGNTIRGIINGAYTLTNDDYSVSEESNNITTITFKASYLDTLSSGDYTFVISYNPLGEAYVAIEGNKAPAETTIALTVNKRPSNVVDTSDMNNITFVFSAMFISLLAIAFLRKKKFEEK